MFQLGNEQPGEQHDEKHRVAGNKKALRIDLRADGLRQCQHDAAEQRAPDRARPADHRRLEGEQQLRLPAIGVESRAHAEEGAGNAHHHHGDGRGDAVDQPRVDADAGPAASASSEVARIARPSGVKLSSNCKAAEQHHGDRKDDHRELPDIDILGDAPGIIRQRADIGRQRTGIGAELFEQHVVDDDGQAEGREDRHQHAAAQAPFQHEPLQQEADDGHHRQDDEEAHPGRNAEPGGQDIEQIGSENREAPMREIDNAHHREHEAEAAGDDRVIAAKQHALDDGVDHAATPSRPRPSPK